jgi:16S rRNA (cytidine1402-2'-O)-methyltransferase
VLHELVPRLKDYDELVPERMRDMSGGQLILAATPLGNILDASPRLKQTLEQADLIAAEDTRRAKRLFADLNLEITAPIISLFDAGTPAISDPGYRLVSKAIEENISITVIPGPSAVLSALVLSGLPTDRFSFEGFIARKGKERTEVLNNLNTQSRTMIIFESPRRTLQTLQDIQEIVGKDRKAAVVREISKTYEEVIRGSIQELIDWASAKEVLGEITLVIAGVENTGKKEVDDEAITEVKQLVTAGSSFKDAVQEVSTQRGLSRRELYEASLRLDS